MLKDILATIIVWVFNLSVIGGLVFIVVTNLLPALFVFAAVGGIVSVYWAIDHKSERAARKSCRHS